MKHTKNLWCLLAGICSCSMAFAQGNFQKGLKGPPPDIEARPPIHVRFAATTGPVGYKPAQIRHAYGFDQITNLGAGQTIAIVDAYGSPSIQQDLNTFCNQFGIPSATVQIYYLPAADVPKVGTNIASSICRSE